MRVCKGSPGAAGPPGDQGPGAKGEKGDPGLHGEVLNSSLFGCCVIPLMTLWSCCLALGLPGEKGDPGSLGVEGKNESQLGLFFCPIIC